MMRNWNIARSYKRYLANTALPDATEWRTWCNPVIRITGLMLATPEALMQKPLSVCKFSKPELMRRISEQKPVLYGINLDTMVDWILRESAAT